MSLEEEISNQINEVEEKVAEEKPKQLLPISGVFNAIFLYLTKDWDEEDRQKLILDDMESENLNEMLTPLIIRLAEKLGLAFEELGAIIGLTGLILPRVFLYVSLKKKYSKKGDKVGNERKEEAGSTSN